MGELLEQVRTRAVSYDRCNGVIFFIFKEGDRDTKVTVSTRTGRDPDELVRIMNLLVARGEQGASREELLGYRAELSELSREGLAKAEKAEKRPVRVRWSPVGLSWRQGKPSANSRDNGEHAQTNEKTSVQGIRLHALRGEWEARIHRKAHKDKSFPRWTLLEDGTAIDETGQKPDYAQLKECVLSSGAVEVKRADGWCINVHKSSLAHLVWEKAGAIVEWVKVEALPDSKEKLEPTVERDSKRKFSNEDKESTGHCPSQSSSGREPARGRRLCIVGAEKKPRLDGEDVAARGSNPALQGQEPESPFIWEKKAESHADPSMRLKIFNMVKSWRFAEVRKYFEQFPSMARMTLTGNQHGGCAGQNLVFAAVQSWEDPCKLCQLLVETYGCDPNHRDSEQRTPIFYLMRSLGNLTQQLACLKYLVNKRKKGEEFDRYQFTPLFTAAYLGRVAFIYELAAWGSDIDIRDAFRNTAARYARATVCGSLVELWS